MSSSSDMKISSHRAEELTAAYTAVLKRVTTTTKPPPALRTPRLVCVSKLKPANDIHHLHTACSHSHFGENYFQELLEKSRILSAQIRWHFIGALQTNKCKSLAEQIPNLWTVESVDSAKKADGLDKGRKALLEKEGERPEGEQREKLRVFVQVNTSGEEEKSGVEPESTKQLCQHIIENCPHLQLQGVMTIGAIARSQAAKEGEENEDFVTLKEVRDSVQKELKLQELELSMGMSEDFESAIRCGSDEVRVGSTIFGARPPKKDAKVKEDIEEGNGT